MKSFPLFLTVQDKIIVIFGGGADAAAKLRLVQKTDARLFVVASCVDHDVLTLGHAIWVQCDPEEFDLPADVAFVYAATGDAELDRRLAWRARQHGALVCAVDQLGVSDFSTPAIVDRDPVVVAIGTEGTAPVLARDIKVSIERLLEPTVGQVARVAHKFRSIVAQVTLPGAQRRQFWQSFFGAARRYPDRAQTIGNQLLRHLSPTRPHLTLAEISIGDQDSFGEQVRRALHDADLVVVGEGVPTALLELARREAMIISDDSSAYQKIARAFRDAERVVALRTTAQWDDLIKQAAEFGIVAQLHCVEPLKATSKRSQVSFLRAA